MKKPTLASCILGAASFLALLGCTQPTLAARLVDVSIVYRSTGERLMPWRHGGRLYVAGTPGDEGTPSVVAPLPAETRSASACPW